MSPEDARQLKGKMVGTVRHFLLNGEARPVYEKNAIGHALHFRGVATFGVRFGALP